LAILASLSLILLGPAFPAQAQSNGSSSSSVTTQGAAGAVITVDTTADNSNTNGKCSLREAITNANDNVQTSPDCQAGSDAAQDTIVFGDGVSGTITLDGDVGWLHITDPKGLAIDGANSGITISGGDTTGVFEVDKSGSELTLNKLRVVHGKPSDSLLGGGVFNNGGMLTVTNSTFSKNTASQSGGGIYSTGQLRVTNSTFSGNSASLGGAISSPDNQGTGEVTGSTFSGNSADQGGAIYNQGALSVVNSTFYRNSAGAGGGIYNGGTATTIGDNRFTAELFLTNDTFSGNSASLANGGGGIISYNPGSVKSTNTIIARSPASDNCSGTVNDGGYNISSDASCAFSEPTSKNSTNPKLAKRLVNNGGPTKTIALLKGSLALDAIPQDQSGCGTQITTDQRGVKRPQGAGCDIGAFERKQRI
jgi:CSLREA domain-containing protein